MQQLSRYYETLINQKSPYVPTNANESTPNKEKELKSQPSINAVKDEIERQKHWLIQLNNYDRIIQQFMKTLSLPNNYKESMTVKYRSKAREDETKNVNN